MLRFCVTKTFSSIVKLFILLICRASLGWFSHLPEWYDMGNNNFALTEAHSVSAFVHHLLNEPVDTQLDMKGRGPENGSSFNNVVRWYLMQRVKWSKLIQFVHLYFRRCIFRLLQESNQESLANIALFLSLKHPTCRHYEVWDMGNDNFKKGRTWNAGEMCKYKKYRGLFVNINFLLVPLLKLIEYIHYNKNRGT